MKIYNLITSQSHQVRPLMLIFFQIPSGALCEYRHRDGTRAKHGDDVNCENGDITLAKVHELCQDKASCQVGPKNPNIRKFITETIQLKSKRFGRVPAKKFSCR